MPGERVAGFPEELADGWRVAINIAVGGQVLVQEGCCKTLHGRVADHGCQSGNEGCHDGSLVECWCLSGFGLAQSNKIRGFGAPTAAGFKSQDDQPATSGLEKFRVSAFLTPSGCMESCPGIGACTAARLPVPCRRGDKDGVDGRLSLQVCGPLCVLLDRVPVHQVEELVVLALEHRVILLHDLAGLLRVRRVHRLVRHGHVLVDGRLVHHEVGHARLLLLRGGLHGREVQPASNSRS